MQILIIILCFIIILFQTLILKILISIKKDSTKESTVKKEKISDIDYLYSLKFNTNLDAIFRSLLDKYDNDTITDMAYEFIIKKDSKCANIPIKELKKYIRDSLRNYTNNYKEPELTESIDKDFDNSDTINNRFITPNEVNLDNILNNFYKD